MIARQDDLKDRVMPPRQARERRDHAGAVVLVQTMELADRPFLDGFAGIERSFQHAFAMRRHQQIGCEAARDFERFAEQRRPQSSARRRPVRDRDRTPPAPRDDCRCRLRCRVSRRGRAPRAPAPRDDDWARCRRRHDCRRAASAGQSTGWRCPVSAILGHDRAGGDVGTALVSRRSAGSAIRRLATAFRRRCSWHGAVATTRCGRGFSIAAISAPCMASHRAAHAEGKARQRIEQIADHR